MDTCKTNNTHQLLDDSQRKLIADEAERLAKLLPLTAIKQYNGRSNISKDLFVGLLCKDNVVHGFRLSVDNNEFTKRF